VALAVFLWLVGLYWPRSLDDAFITVAYAAEWLRSGTLRWTSGEVVEGYSHPTWLLVDVAALAGRVDPIVVGKLLSLAAGAWTAALFAWRAPLGAAGTLTAAAVVVWTPLAHWSALGIETTAFALLLALGWEASWSRRHGAALAFLAAAALTRPEGHLFLAVAGARALSQRAFRPLALAGAVVVLYHAIRVAHFEHVWPTPFLVKVASHGGALARSPLSQLGDEALSAAGVLACVGVLWRTPARALAWALGPLAALALLLLQMRGDWMGWGRILLPGVTALAWTVLRHGQPRALGGAGWGVAPVVLAGLHEPAAPDRGPRMVSVAALGHPLRGWGEPSTPSLVDDLQWAVENVPDGATILAADVGLLGNLPGVRVRDIAGLVDREIAEQRASGVAADALWKDAYGPRADQIGFLRLTRWDPDAMRLPDWLERALPVASDLLLDWGTVRWAHVPVDPVSARRRVERWDELRRRFPAQPWFEWRWLLARADAGEPFEAVRADLPARTRFVPLVAGVASLSFPRSERPLHWVEARGFALYRNGWVATRPLSEGARLVVDVDDPGSEGVRLEIAWSDGCAASAATFPARAEVPLASLRGACGAGRAVTARIAFVNDAAGPDGDRNAYLSVVE
jgi:hypothetical protein